MPSHSVPVLQNNEVKGPEMYDFGGARAKRVAIEFSNIPRMYVYFTAPRLNDGKDIQVLFMDESGAVRMIVYPISFD